MGKDPREGTSAQIKTLESKNRLQKIRLGLGMTSRFSVATMLVRRKYSNTFRIMRKDEFHPRQTENQPSYKSSVWVE